jgi:hypothetical protein
LTTPDTRGTINIRPPRGRQGDGAMVSQQIQDRKEEYMQVMRDHAAMSPDEIVASVSATQHQLMEIFRSAGDAQAASKPAPGEWSLHELAAHAAFTERLIAKLVHLIARSSLPTPEDLAGAGIGMMPPADARSYGEVLDELQRRNADLLDAVRSLPAEPDLELALPHPFFGPLTCLEWAGFQRVHDTDHIEHARRIIAETA